MSLTPKISFPEVVNKESVRQKKTHSFNFATGEMGSRIDGFEALTQSIRKMVKTIRFNHIIYPDYYGNEAHSLIGKPITNSYINSEIERMITEAIIYDDRIHNVSDFVITHYQEYTHVKFTVDSVEGVLTLEEQLYAKGG